LAPLAAELDALTELQKVRDEEPPVLDQSAVLEALVVFAEFAFLEFQQKRRILEVLLPLIYVYRYVPKGIVFQPAALCGDSVIHSNTADSVTTFKQPEKLMISSGLYVPLCA
jgi:hypothetical protein